MQIDLRQRGRASMGFLTSTARANGRLEPRIQADIAAAGITEDTLADDLDDRDAQMEIALAQSQAFGARNLLSDWLSINHGVIATEAVEEIMPALTPQIDALSDGPTTIEAFAHFTGPPDYIRNVWIHRTHNGWDGHEHQGLIHGELVHKRYLNHVYGDNIFERRRAVLDHLPRKDYRRIFEMGVSSGHHTLALADAFPKAQISGCDFARPMLEQAQRVANERQLKWRLYVGDAEDTRLPEGSFDLVSSFIILHELPATAIRKVFSEAWRLLEPGGTMVMTDVPPSKEQDKLTGWKLDRNVKFGGEPYWREAGEIDTAALAQEIGFKNARAFRLPGGGNYWVTIGEKA